jgi:hypothetical protein
MMERLVVIVVGLIWLIREADVSVLKDISMLFVVVN